MTRSQSMSDSQGASAPFNVFHPDFQEWIDQIDWDLHYDLGADAAAAVIGRMTDLGFTIIPPPLPRYAVTYMGHTEYRTDDLAQAERFLSKLERKVGTEIKDRQPG